MQQQESTKGTADEKIASKAKVWRMRQKKRIAEPSNETKRAEHLALSEVAQAVDQAGEH